MNAIVTKYRGPSSVRGSRIIASDSDGNRATWLYEDALSEAKNHEVVARKLCNKMGWTGVLVMGHLGDSERVWVWVEMLHGCGEAAELLNGIEVR